MAEEKSYYQTLLDNANANINASLPSAAATDDQMFARYLDRYKTLGQTAMRDTIGVTNALTGGYANSYSQNVGQQAYDEYIKGANDQMLDYAMQSKEMALKQSEYANNLANAEYARNLDAANLAATYGDFSLYGNMFGTDNATAWQSVWDKMNPNITPRAAVATGGGYYGGGSDDSSNNSNERGKILSGISGGGNTMSAIANLANNGTFNIYHTAAATKIKP